jgi:hypothetical protein
MMNIKYALKRLRTNRLLLRFQNSFVWEMHILLKKKEKQTKKTKIKTKQNKNKNKKSEICYLELCMTYHMIHVLISEELILMTGYSIHHVMPLYLTQRHMIWETIVCQIFCNYCSVGPSSSTVIFT